MESGCSCFTRKHTLVWEGLICRRSGAIEEGCGAFLKGTRPCGLHSCVHQLTVRLTFAIILSRVECPLATWSYELQFPIRLRRVSLAGQLLKKCRSRLPAHMYSYVHKHNVGARKSQSGAILNTPRIFVTSQRREKRYNRIPVFSF